MTSLPLVSSTQIETFAGADGSGAEGCERKWGFRYLERVEVPQHPSAKLGTEVQDEQLDPWLGEGRGFDFTRPSGEIANALAPLLPRPKAPGMILRRWFGLPNPAKPGAVEIVPSPEERASRALVSPRGTHGYRGELDLYALDSSIVPGLVLPTMRATSPGLQALGPVPLVGDIKTTGNLTYAKTADKLAKDVQAQLYAMAIMFHENVDVLDLAWFYTRTKGARRVERHQLRVSSSHVFAEFQRIDEIGARVTAIKLARPKVEELRPNVRLCDSFGGCPFRSRCTGSTSPTVQAAEVNREAVIQMNASSNSFLDKLRKNTTAPVAPSTPAASMPAGFAQAQAQAQSAAQQAAADPALVTAQSAASAPPPFPPTGPAGVMGILDSQVPPVPVTSTPAWATAPVAARAPINPPESSLPPMSVASPSAAPAATLVAAEPARRGRPPKAAKPEAEVSPEPIVEGVPMDAINGFVALMREQGIRRLAFEGTSVREIELVGGTP